MKKLLLLFLFLTLLTSAKASHIVGGEFELKYLNGNTYRLSLIVYFDELNGSPGAKDPSVTARFFSKRNNSPVFLTPGSANTDWVTLFLTEETDVEYTQLECSKGEIVTNKLVYTTNVILRSDVFTDDMGYYIAWERCCRNYTITNIFSENPQAGGINFAGQAFYLEFPAVVKDGEPFINNSPRLFPPLNDFACPYIPYYVDFAGVDDDGDSLVYSLVTPLNTWTADALPPPAPPGIARPGPYPDVQWKPGFGLDNILNGVKNLEISNEGFLTVIPRDQGLYVFAVKCEEFRDGVKIGEVRRDFQMLVVQTGGCPDPSNRPSIVGKGPLDSDFGTTGKLTISFANTVPIEDRCFEVKVSDPSALIPAEGSQENIKISAVALDFKKKINEVLPAIKTDLIVNGEEAFFQICFPNVCPYKPEGTFKIGIVASDDACALPLTDTLYVTVTIEPPPNVKPEFNNQGGLEEIIETLQEGDAAKSWELEATDADGDALSYRLVPINFTLENVGMTFTAPLAGQQAGTVNKLLTWDPKCDVYDFTEKTNFELYFIVEDNDVCKTIHADTTFFNLSIDLPGNNDPVIENSILSNVDTLEFDYKIYGEPIVIDVNGTDLDTDDLIVLRGSGVGFNFASIGASFPKKIGKGELESLFEWKPDCSNFNQMENDVFSFRLMVVDSTNKCRFYKADTLLVIVHVEPPDNLDPELLIESENPDQPIISGSITSILGSPIELTLSGFDEDVSPIDVLKLELIEKSGNVNPTGFEFVLKEGNSPLQTSFTWSPDCSIFENGLYENNYTFKFVLSDNRCFAEKGDTVTIDLTIKDVDGGDEEFLAPNAFSPNGDEWNKFFAMVKEVGPGEFESILPKDNCVGEFIGITFYNRWGKQVYESSNPDFRWYGEDLPTGIYYYYLLYSNKAYKGLVSIQY